MPDLGQPELRGTEQPRSDAELAPVRGRHKVFLGMAAGAGTLRTDTPTFGGFLIATVLLLALLTFVGGLLAGPSVQALTLRLLS
jgi:hypothetical protein